MPADQPWEMSAAEGRASASGGPARDQAGDGPGAVLRYSAGGVGHPDYPGSTDWNTTLGRYWSHDYAERIVQDPIESHVWLLTKTGLFREFRDLDAVTGAYATVGPSDEYRKLTWLGTGLGWELRSLDGTRQIFDGSGKWQRTVERTGVNETVGTYDGSGRLSQVDFPDGRRELFTYNVGTGKLETITEIGVGVLDCGAEPEGCRQWVYGWTGLDLTRIDRPDGTAWVFEYTSDPNFPGYLTKKTLEGTDASQRVEAAWEYDAFGNVFRTWKGAANFDDLEAVGKFMFAYDDPAAPTQTTVTDLSDPLDPVDAIYTFDRDPWSSKARLLSVGGDCPVCGIGTRSFEYGDASNPLLPTAVTDGEGHRTEYTYDANGQVLTRREAVLEPEERLTSWTYAQAPFESFVETMTQASVEPGMNRVTVMAYDPIGNLMSRQILGFGEEFPAGSDCTGAGPNAFDCLTTFLYNPAGQVTESNPPGYSGVGEDDRTVWTYDSTRGDLLPLTRSDPVLRDLGVVTSFAYDDFNRRARVTDLNGVETDTQYDPACWERHRVWLRPRRPAPGDPPRDAGGGAQPDRLSR